MLPFQERVVNEHRDLADKLYRLDNFLLTDTFKALPQDEQFRLCEQRECMRRYSDVLQARIAQFPLPEDPPVPAAPKITMDHILGCVVGDDYYQFPNTTVTVCLLQLRNGFSVLGKSACVCPANFDAELGRKLARENALNGIWHLEGYALAQRLYENAGAK